MIGKVYQSVVDFYDSKTQTTRKKVRKEKGDMKTHLPELYLKALEKMEQFQREVLDRAIS